MTETAVRERLGELLLREGRLRQAALERALEAQGLVGGRLGTNLLELGLIGEGPLLEAIGRQRSTCTAGRAELARISPAVLRAVPEKLARRFKLVPYEVRGKTLFVASADPGDLLWEDEITFLTTFMVRTCVALELHVMLALRQHYGVPIDRRFLALARRLRSGVGPPAAIEESPSPGSPSRRSPSAPSAFDVPPPSASQAATAPPSSPASPPPRPHATPAAPDVEFIELDADDLALLRGGDEAGAAEPPGHRAPPQESLGPAVSEPAGELPEPYAFTLSDDDDAETRLAKAALALQQADIRDEIGDVLLTTGGAYFARRLLLIARRGRIVGWRGAGEGLDEQRIRELDLDEKAPSIFAGLRDAGSFWLGPLPPLPANRQLVEAMGGPPPKDCLALPVVLRSKVVAHLYADNLERGVGGAPLADMKRLAAKAGLAFEVYILKNKIRML